MSDDTTNPPAPVGETDLPDDERVPWVMAEPKEVAPGEERTNWFFLAGLVGLMAMLWFWAGPRYFLVVVGLLIMIFLHELGHFLTARWTGMKVTQFFLFMGPRIFSFRRGETEYGLRLLPIGAFVRIVGMNNLDPCPPEDEPRAYRNKSYPRRMLVITAGSFMHFVQAVILFIVVSSVIGLPDTEKWSISEISRLETGETPAVEAGLAPGDTIVSVTGADLDDATLSVTTGTADFEELRDFLRARPGEEVTLEIQTAEGTLREATTTLAELPVEVRLEDGSVERQTVGFLGVAPSFENVRRSPLVGVQDFGSAFWGSLTTIPRFLSPGSLFNLVQLTFEGPAQVDLADDEVQERPVSLIGAVRIAGAPDFDWVVPVTMLAYINVFVGIFNLIPLLPLDGGHAAIATYERIRSRPGRRYQMDVAKLLPLTYAVVFFLGFLMLTTVWLDIFRPIG